MTYTIERKLDPKNPDVLAVATPLQQFNQQTGPPINYLVVLLQVLDAEGKVAGGLFGQIAYDWLHVEYLVVPEDARHQGLGRSLMEQAETIARERNCRGIWLNTLAFQARGFYERVGFEVFGTLEDHPRKGALYFMQKKLDA